MFLQKLSSQKSKYRACKTCNFTIERKITNAVHGTKTECILMNFFCDVCVKILINSDKPDRSQSEHVKKHHVIEFRKKRNIVVVLIVCQLFVKFQDEGHQKSQDSHKINEYKYDLER